MIDVLCSCKNLEKLEIWSDEFKNSYLIELIICAVNNENLTSVMINTLARDEIPFNVRCVHLRISVKNDIIISRVSLIEHLLTPNLRHLRIYNCLISGDFTEDFYAHSQLESLDLSIWSDIKTPFTKIWPKLTHVVVPVSRSSDVYVNNDTCQSDMSR